MYKLRCYQEEAVTSVFTYFERGNKGNPLIGLPGGTGKSIVIAYFIGRAKQWFPTTRILMLTHVQELIVQNHEKLSNSFPDIECGIFSASLSKKQYSPDIVYGQVQSVANAVQLFGHIDLVFIDEAHLVPDDQSTRYRYVLDQLQKVNPSIKVIGCTATPYRTGSGSLIGGGVFTDFCYNRLSLEDYNWFVGQGYLSPLVVKQTVQQLDVSQVPMSGNEFVQKHLDKAVNTDVLNEAMCAETATAGYEQNRQKWLVFTTSIDHAEKVASIFNSYGVATGVIHSKLHKSQRRQVLKQFFDGDIKCLVNKDILTTGTDIPAIDLLAVMRPIGSTALWVQIVSRAARTAYGKDNALIMDFGANTERLGPINDPIVPSNKKKRKNGENVATQAPVKVCVDCKTYNHSRARVCISCGKEFPISSNGMTEIASTAEIVAKEKKPKNIIFDITNVVYSKRQSIGKEFPHLRVTYWAGVRSFVEVVCLQHDRARFQHVTWKARQWWRARSNLPVPTLIDVALANANGLKKPVQLIVDCATTKPKIIKHIF